MITRFKLFESTEETIKEVSIEDFEDYSYWIIYGSQLHCIDILNKLKLKLKLNLGSDLNTVIRYIRKDIKDKIFPNTIGTVIFYNKIDNFSYYPYERKYDIEEYIKNYNFKGEMKEIDGKVVVDTLEVYTKKYNL